MTELGAAILVALGLLIGSFGTFIGAGGGFLIVPLLLIGYQFSPPDAVGTSLSVVFLNALSGSVAYARQRRIDFSLGCRRTLRRRSTIVTGPHHESHNDQ